MTQSFKDNVSRLRRARESQEIIDIPGTWVTGFPLAGGGVDNEPQRGLPANLIWVHDMSARQAFPALVGDRMLGLDRSAGKRVRLGFTNPGRERMAYAPYVDETTGDSLRQIAAADAAARPVPAENILDGRVQAPDAANAGLRAYINADASVGWMGGYVEIDPGDVPANVNEFVWLVWYFPAAGIGTSAYAPTYAVTATVTRATKEQVPISLARDLALPVGAIRLFATTLAYGQTDITNDNTRFVNLRNFNTPSGTVLVDVSGGSPGDVPTLQADGTTFELEAPGTGSIAVDDGTTTVDPTTQLTFDPAYFDVTAPGGDQAMVTFIGGGIGGNVTVNTYATARPASPSVGDIFVPTDGVWNQEVWDGSAWRPLRAGNLLTTPPAAGWTWDNQGSATIDFSTGAGFLFVPAGTTTLAFRLQYRTAPSTPYTITTLLDPIMLGSSNPYYAIGFRESSSGKLHALMVQSNLTALQIFSSKFTNSTTFSANYTSAQFWKPHAIWLRITDNGTNRILSVSADGKNFIPFHSVSRVDFLTADQVFFGLAPTSASFDAGLTLFSWG